MPKIKNNYVFIGDNNNVMKGQKFQGEIKSVDMIYIDPPYNTGTKFSYDDKKNTEDWINFMKVRLELAKKVLSEDGVLFISIDDNEYATLKILCDEIFSKKNFVGTFITQQAQRSNAKLINTVHEYVVCYAKEKEKLQAFKIKRVMIPEEKTMIDYMSNEIKNIFWLLGKDESEKKLGQLIKKFCLEKNITWLKNYCNVDENGKIFFAKDLSTPGQPRKVEIPEIGLYLDPLPTRGWSSDKKLIDLFNKGLLCFKGKRPYEKHYLEDSEDNVSSLLNFYSRQGTNDLNKLGLRDLFDTPKPVELIKFLIRIAMKKDGVCLDFFAGCGTTAQAVYELNKEDNGERKYVLIQLDEKVEESSKVFSACKKYGIKPYVSEILLHRIRTFLDRENMLDNNLIIIK